MSATSDNPAGSGTALLNTIPTPVLLLDARRRIVAFNGAAAGLFGSALTGRDIVLTLRQPEVLDAISGVLRGDAARECDLVMQGQVRATYRLSVAWLQDKAFPDARVTVCLFDITDVTDAHEMRSDFVANVSHELRSPLTAISGFIETLRGAARNDGEAADRFLALMDTETRRMTRLIADLLSLSKVQARQRLRPTGRVDIEKLLQRSIATLRGRADMTLDAIAIDASADDPLVPGDEDELLQVFLNLIENAVKYSGSDQPVRITLRAVPHMAGIAGPALAIAVEDHGEGIAARHLGRLTERFYRVDTHRSRDQGGTGLGLAIVKHIINRHRGRLLITSEVGKGSTFTVVLPVQ